nr:hypothetical protein Iba_chr02cCG9200 [Ipomoea batatas]
MQGDSSDSTDLSSTDLTSTSTFSPAKTIYEVRAAAASFGFDTFKSNNQPDRRREVPLTSEHRRRTSFSSDRRRAGGQVRVLRCGEWWIGSRVWSSSVAGSHYLAHFTWDFRAIWVPLILLWLLGFIDFPLSVQMRGHEGDMNGILSLWSGALVSVFKCVPTAVDYGVKKLCKNNNVGGIAAVGLTQM